MRIHVKSCVVIFLICNFAATGCNRTPNVDAPVEGPKLETVKFAADTLTGKLAGKGQSVTVVFTKHVNSVAETLDGVKAEKHGNKVIFTQVGDSPDEDRRVVFAVKGPRAEDNVDVTVILAKHLPAAVSPTQPAEANVVPFVLDVDDLFAVKFPRNAKRDTQVWVKARSGTILRAIPPPRGAKVTWNFDPEKKAIQITVSTSATSKDARPYEMTVFGNDSAGKTTRVMLKFTVVETELEPFVLDDGGDLKVLFHRGKDTQVWVKAKTGTINASSSPPENSGVTWKFDRDMNAIAITVAGDAGPEDLKEYEIKVRGKDGHDNTTNVLLKFKVDAEPFALDVNGKLEVKLKNNASEDMRVRVKARSGMILKVDKAPADSKVSWKFHPDEKAIEIVVSKEAGRIDAREYTVGVWGRDDVGKQATVNLNFTVGLAADYSKSETKLGVNGEK
jgi:hypothetical protein